MLQKSGTENTDLSIRAKWWLKHFSDEELLFEPQRYLKFLYEYRTQKQKCLCNEPGSSRCYKKCPFPEHVSVSENGFLADPEKRQFVKDHIYPQKPFHTSWVYDDEYYVKACDVSFIPPPPLTKKMLLPIDESHFGYWREVFPHITFENACEAGNIDMVIFVMVQLYFHPYYHSRREIEFEEIESGFKRACSHGHNFIIEMLLRKFSFKGNDGQLLMTVCKYFKGKTHRKWFDLLKGLKVNNPHDMLQAFCYCCENETYTLMDFFLLHFNTEGIDFVDLACIIGKLEPVKYIIETHKPTFFLHRWLRTACDSNRMTYKLIQYLIDVKMNVSVVSSYELDEYVNLVLTYLLISRSPDYINVMVLFVERGANPLYLDSHILCLLLNYGLHETYIHKHKHFHTLHLRRTEILDYVQTFLQSYLHMDVIKYDIFHYVNYDEKYDEKDGENYTIRTPY